MRCKWCNEVVMGDFHSEDNCAMKVCPLCTFTKEKDESGQWCICEDLGGKD